MITNDNIRFKRLKLFFKNNGFRLAHRLAIYRLKKLVKANPETKKKSDGKKILFNLIYGMHGKLIYWECGLAKALQLRGHDVKVLTCGKAFTMCTSEYTVQSVHDDKTCKHCLDFSKDFLEVTGIPHSTYNEYISSEQIQKIKEKVKKLSNTECENFDYKDINVGNLATNAVMRYFEGTLSPDKDEYGHVLHSEIINAIIAIDAGEKIVEMEKPDIVVTRHVGYSSWGSFAEYCTNKDIRVCYPGEGYRKDTIGFDFNINSIIDNNFKKYYEEIRKKKPLNKKEEEELQSFIYKRIHGKEGDTAIYGFTTTNVEHRFDIDKYKKTLAIFPNVAWDSSLLNAHKGFKDVYEWITYTIELFKKKPEYQLLVKIHPSETTFAMSKNTVSDYITSILSPLPENIKIIPPDTDISPYSLFSFIDAGIVYNGTIGLEMSLHGIPVIVAGIPHYGKKGFTWEVTTKQEYKDALFNTPHTLSKKAKELVKIYAYFYFIKSYFTYDFVYKRGFFNVGWKFNSIDDLSKGKNKSLDRICDYILNGGIY